jgi:polysaccharide pyruvyl transferase CsaB
MVNILIAGYYGLGNIGDEAILAGMVTSLKKCIPNANISVITNDSNVTIHLHKVNPVKHSFKKGLSTFLKNGLKDGEFADIYKAIDNCDIFILGGGSLLQDLKLYYLPALYSLLYLAQKKHKITVVYGIGAGPIDTKFGRYISKKILNNVDLVTVRDSMSKNVLEKCGVKNVVQTIDPAFGMNLPNEQEIKLLIAQENIQSQNLISTTIYNWLQDSDIYCNPNKPYSEMHHRRKSMASIYDKIITKYNRKIMFVPTVKTDIEVYSQINELISVENQSLIKEYRTEFDYVFSLLFSSEILIGMRLHSLILATIIGIPFVPISYCGKVKSFLEMIDMPDFYLDVETIGKPEFENTLLLNFDKIYNNKQYYSNLLLEKSQTYREVALENAKLVAKLI